MVDPVEVAGIVFKNKILLLLDDTLQPLTGVYGYIDLPVNGLEKEQHRPGHIQRPMNQYQ